MPCQHGVSSQPLGSCSSSSLSGLLCSNGEQTPFMRLSRSFLLGLGPEEGDVTKMQTDDGSQHLGWERVASPRRGGAVPCVQGGSCSERDPEHTLHSFCLRTIGLFHAVWGGTDLRGTPGLRTCCHPCIPPPRKAAAVAPAAGALPALTKRLQVSLQLGGGLGGSAGAVVNTALPITPFCFSPVDLGEGDAECNIHVSEMPTVWGQAQKISWLRGFCFGFVAFGIESGMFCCLGGLVTKAFLLLYFLRYSLGMEKGTDSSSAGTVRFAVCARGKEQSWAAFSSTAAGSLREDPASLPSHLGDGDGAPGWGRWEMVQRCLEHERIQEFLVPSEERMRLPFPTARSPSSAHPERSRVVSAARSPDGSRYRAGGRGEGRRRRAGGGSVGRAGRREGGASAEVVPGLRDGAAVRSAGALRRGCAVPNRAALPVMRSAPSV